MLLRLAGIVGVLGIAVGAFGDHALPDLLSDLSESELAEREGWLKTGATYHMYHALALLAVAVADHKWNRAFRVSALAWLLGIVLFSGSLYAMSLTGIRVLGAIVPLGGIAYMLGWGMLLASAGRGGGDADASTLLAN